MQAARDLRANSWVTHYANMLNGMKLFVPTRAAVLQWWASVCHMQRGSNLWFSQILMPLFVCLFVCLEGSARPVSGLAFSHVMLTFQGLTPFSVGKHTRQLFSFSLRPLWCSTWCVQGLGNLIILCFETLVQVVSPPPPFAWRQLG